MCLNTLVNKVSYFNVFFNEVLDVNDCTIMFSTLPIIRMTFEILCAYYRLSCFIKKNMYVNVVPISEFFVSSLNLPYKVNSTCNKLLVPIFILVFQVIE
jgi:hypothetical protein